MFSVGSLPFDAALPASTSAEMIFAFWSPSASMPAALAISRSSPTDLLWSWALVLMCSSQAATMAMWIGVAALCTSAYAGVPGKGDIESVRWVIR